MGKLTEVEKDCIRFYLKLKYDKVVWHYGNTAWLVASAKAGRILDSKPFDKPSPDNVGITRKHDIEIYRNAIIRHPWVERVKDAICKVEIAKVYALYEGKPRDYWVKKFERARDYGNAYDNYHKGLKEEGKKWLLVLHNIISRVFKK